MLSIFACNQPTQDIIIPNTFPISSQIESSSSPPEIKNHFYNKSLIEFEGGSAQIQLIFNSNNNISSTTGKTGSFILKQQSFGIGNFKISINKIYEGTFKQILLQEQQQQQQQQQQHNGYYELDVLKITNSNSESTTSKDIIEISNDFEQRYSVFSTESGTVIPSLNKIQFKLYLDQFGVSCRLFLKSIDRAQNLNSSNSNLSKWSGISNWMNLNNKNKIKDLLIEAPVSELKLWKKY